MLEGAEHVMLETDALATAIGISKRARTPAMQAILGALQERAEYRRLAPRLQTRHLAGSANILSDAASRSYHDTLRAVGRALGIETRRLPLPPAAVEFLSDALDRVAKTRPGLGLGGRPAHTATRLGCVVVRPRPHADPSCRPVQSREGPHACVSPHVTDAGQHGPSLDV